MHCIFPRVTQLIMYERGKGHHVLVTLEQYSYIGSQ